MGEAAIFRCRYTAERVTMTIRWFYEFEIPKVRYEFGWNDCGTVDDYSLGKAWRGW